MEISIHDLLAHHPAPGIREANIRHTVAEAITKLTSVPVGPEKIQHKEGKIVVNVPPVLKSALLLRSSELTELLKEEGIVLMELR